MEWRDIEDEPENGEYVLVSFANYPLPGIAEYRDGAFYHENGRKYLNWRVFVNGWMPLPKCREVDA